MTPMPRTLSVNNMKYLLTFDSSESREKYLSYLYRKEIKKVATSIAKMKMKSTFKEKAENRSLVQNTNGIFNSTNGDISYGLWHNSLFTRIKQGQTKANGKLATSKLRTAAQFGQKLVIDLSMLKYLDLSQVNLSLKHCGSAFDCNRVQTIEGMLKLWFYSTLFSNFLLQLSIFIFVERT